MEQLNETQRYFIEEHVEDFRDGLIPRRELIRLGCNVEWHSYPMEHSVSMEEVDDIGAWLRCALS